MVPYGFKRCSKCGEVKAVVLFSKDLSRKDGFQAYCKACNKAYCQANKEAIREQKKAYREANKAARAEYLKANREAILEKQKAYDKANRKAILEKKKTYKKANRPLMNEINAKRRAKKKKNTPKLIRDCPVDRQRRVFAYNLARLLTETTGVEHHVDHMWPISDGGPHWSGNLQVIPAVDNLSKHASVDEEIKKTIKEGLEYAKRESK